MVLDEHVVDAATFGDVNLVSAWLHSLERPGDINEVDADGTTVLNLCARGFDNHYLDDDNEAVENEVAIVKMILAKGGANVNLADKYGWTPLHHACDSNPLFGLAVIRALLAAGADINAKTSGVRKEDSFGVVAAVQTPLATAIDWFRCAADDTAPAGFDAECTRTALEYVALLLRHGASLDDCWAGAPVENLLRHVEDRTTPAMEMWFGNDKWAASTPQDLSQNEHFLACKALVKKARSEPRKTVLTLRALAIKGRAKTTDPVMKFLVGIPDGVTGNVLSFWPPATRYIAARRPGTSQLPYRPKREIEVVKAPTCYVCGRSNRPNGCPGCFGARPGFDRHTENVHHAISMSPAYSGKSFEELRLEDYELGRDAGKWWIGGTLQINNDRDMAAALDALQLGLPSDSNLICRFEEPTYGFPRLDNEGNIIT